MAERGDEHRCCSSTLGSDTLGHPQGVRSPFPHLRSPSRHRGRPHESRHLRRERRPGRHRDRGGRHPRSRTRGGPDQGRGREHEPPGSLGPSRAAHRDPHAPYRGLGHRRDRGRDRTGRRARSHRYPGRGGPGPGLRGVGGSYSIRRIRLPPPAPPGGAHPGGIRRVRGRARREPGPASRRRLRRGRRSRGPRRGDGVAWAPAPGRTPGRGAGAGHRGVRWRGEHGGSDRPVGRGRGLRGHQWGGECREGPAARRPCRLRPPGGGLRRPTEVGHREGGGRPDPGLGG